MKLLQVMWETIVTVKDFSAFLDMKEIKKLD